VKDFLAEFAQRTHDNIGDVPPSFAVAPVATSEGKLLCSVYWCHVQTDAAYHAGNKKVCDVYVYPTVTLGCASNLIFVCV
jgi:hypothetical protein